jgi:hypothetical protein
MAKEQNGTINGIEFNGNPQNHEVSLSMPYDDANYTISVMGDDSRVWSIAQKTTSSFIISSNSNVPLNGNVYWTAKNI